MDDKVIDHFCHEHPLILTENVGNEETLCYGCRKPVVSELAYVCIDEYCITRSGSIIHKRCAELPKQISHASHSLHHLHIHDYSGPKNPWSWNCNLCDVRIEGGIGYLCHICKFAFDISCPKVGCINDSSEKERLQHKSHYHPLTLIRRPTPTSFNCDACGTDDSDMCYMCSTCEFSIHKTCALLPENTLLTNLHHHQLSLAFNLPSQYRNWRYNCAICRKQLLTTYWVYYCDHCRYFVHVKCATQVDATKQIIPAESSSNLNVDDLVQLPADDFSKELITPFVIRARENDGLGKIPDTKDLPTSVTMPQTTASFSVLFNYHKHPLSLVSERPTLTDELLTMICDVCVTTIHSPPYYHCLTCNSYSVHSTCYFLPKTFSCPEAYGDCPRTHKNHKVSLYTGSELDNHRDVRCDICRLHTNGRVYGCGDCKLVMDVKCAALPTTLKHSSHPHILMMKKVQKEGVFRSKACDGCRCSLRNFNSAYYCTDPGCDFALDIECVLLPKSIKHEWDKHPLPLTYEPTIDHPSDFYCEDCEEEIYPKSWMYHCRECDRSFDLLCVRRNLKYGRRLEFDHHLHPHPHPLTMTEVTIKLKCDDCHKECHQYAGFQCELCNFVLCYRCGLRKLSKM